MESKDKCLLSESGDFSKLQQVHNSIEMKFDLAGQISCSGGIH